MYKKYFKRTLDIALAGLLLVLLLPFVAIVALIIKIDSKGPVFFKQKRYGQHKKPFTVYKFRTMYSHAPNDRPTNEFLDSHNYITRPGKIMRKLSIDELPQLMNVLHGKMSVVGPRPVVLSEKRIIKLRDKYGANALKPGITGWAQANGRDELNDTTKAKMDGYYLENFGFMTDIKCILKTIRVILSAAGHAEGHERKITQEDSPLGEAES